MKDNKFKVLSQKLLFNVSEEVVDKIEQEWENLNKQIVLMETFDTKNVYPLERVDDTTVSYLREDEEDGTTGENVSKGDILKNAFFKNNDFIIVQKGKNGD